MNNSRRKEIMREIHKLGEIRERLEEIKADEEMAMENLPENLQYNSEQWEKMEEWADTLDTSITELESTQEDLESYLETN